MTGAIGFPLPATEDVDNTIADGRGRREHGSHTASAPGPTIACRAGDPKGHHNCARRLRKRPGSNWRRPAWESRWSPGR